MQRMQQIIQVYHICRHNALGRTTLHISQAWAKSVKGVSSNSSKRMSQDQCHRRRKDMYLSVCPAEGDCGQQVLLLALDTYLAGQTSLDPFQARCT